jgi:hypothetical protein
MTVVLVEGESDRAALEALAKRRGRDLAAENVTVVAIGGVQAIRRVLASHDPDVGLAGLCDEQEAALVRRALGVDTDEELERRGFFVCRADLEDELIRALGAARVEAVIAANGELVPFRTLQKQPEWRGRPLHEQLRRFLGNSTRKFRYARLLVEALDLAEAPRPLVAVLEYVSGSEAARS